MEIWLSRHRHRTRVKDSKELREANLRGPVRGLIRELGHSQPESDYLSGKADRELDVFCNEVIR